jgi:hypothetical protein
MLFNELASHPFSLATVRQLFRELLRTQRLDGEIVEPKIVLVCPMTSATIRLR